MNSNYKIYWYYFKITAIPAGFLVLLGIIIWKININDLQKKQSDHTIKIIRNVIEDQTSRELFIPSIIVLNRDSIIREQVKDSIYALLVNRYFLNESKSDKSLALTNPLSLITNPTDKKGNYILTREQLISLQNHISFLVSQVDRQVSESQESVARDIDRLNLWVSIWIGVIGFLGIFIPVIINIDTSKSAQTALEQSISAVDSINKVRPEIDKIPGIEAKIVTAEQKLGSIETKSNVAEQKATASEEKSIKAERKSNALYLVHSVGKLMSFEQDISLLPKDKIVPFLKKILESIHKNIIECGPIFDETIVKDSLKDLGISLAKLSYYTNYIGLERTEKLDHLSGRILDLVKKEIDSKEQEALAKDLKVLIEGL